MSVGSASTRATPSFSSALMLASVFALPAEPMMLMLVFETGWLVESVTGKLSRKSVGDLKTRQFVPVMSMPSCLMMSRVISAIVTLTITWSLARTVSELITSPVASFAPPSRWPTKPFAMSIACWASRAEPTSPVRITVLSTAVTVIAEFGIATFKVRRSLFMSRPTRISRLAIWAPCASMMKTLVAPSLMAIRKTLRVERTTALATLGLATNTSLASRGRSTTIDLPMPRLIFSGTAGLAPVTRIVDGVSSPKLAGR